jgi:hypothetical protein
MSADTLKALVGYLRDAHRETMVVNGQAFLKPVASSEA